jgi:hemoglobin
MNRRAIACFDQAMDDGQITDPVLRRVLHDCFERATTTTMSAYHKDAAQVPVR